MREKHRLLIQISVAVFSVTAVILCFVLFKKGQISSSIDTLQKHYLIALLLILLVFALKPILFFIPSSLELGFTSVIFPWYIAIIINTAGIVLQIVSGYFIGMLFGKKFVDKIINKNEKIKKIHDKFFKENFYTIFIAHFTPMFPYDQMSMLYGANKSNLFRYVVVSVLGLAPRITAFSISGAYIRNPLSVQFILPLVIVGALSLAGFYLFNKKVNQNTKLQKTK